MSLCHQFEIFCSFLCVCNPKVIRTSFFQAIFHITLSTVLNMTDTEMDQLANFLGHDIRIHREFYRLPEKTLQLAKISKVLMALEQGRLSEFQGKNLDEISIDPNGLYNIHFTLMFKYRNFVFFN